MNYKTRYIINIKFVFSHRTLSLLLTFLITICLWTVSIPSTCFRGNHKNANTPIRECKWADASAIVWWKEKKRKKKIAHNCSGSFSILWNLLHEPITIVGLRDLDDFSRAHVIYSTLIADNKFRKVTGIMRFSRIGVQQLDNTMGRSLVYLKCRLILPIVSEKVMIVSGDLHCLRY